jgi:predicted PurR-regulated permease PerM
MNRVASASADGTSRGSRRLPSLTIALLFVLVIAALYWAQAILIPFALAILLTFLLSPATIALQQTGLGRVPSVALVIVLTFCLLGTIGWVAAAQLTSLAGELPNYRHNIRQKIRDLRDMIKGGALERIQETVEEVKGEFDGVDKSPAIRTPSPVVVQTQPAASWRSLYLGPLAQPLASAGLVFGMLIFMLAQREELRNRLIRVIGYGNLTVTTKALEDAGHRIGRYLLMQITINGCFGLIVAVALFLIGLPYAFLWGFLSVPLLFVPVIGFWTATALPTILSLAVFAEWWWPLVVIGLFLGLKTVINMLLEPLVYGKSVGVSPVPLLMMIAFWTWLWGPIGLILATPLTVCLVVFAKYVPQLQFIGVLLSDEPVMETKISYYQRLLAMDQDEAIAILEDYLAEHPREQVYDEVLVPALISAKTDLSHNNITEREEQFIFNATREILEYLANFEHQSPANSVDGSQSPAPENAVRKIRILGCPAHDEADELGLLMLRQLLDSTRYELEIISAGPLASETIAVVGVRNPRLVCVAALPPGGLAQARYLCKRLRSLSPALKIVVGRWAFPGELGESRDSLLSAGADQVGSSLRQTRDQMTNLRSFISDEAPANRDPVARGQHR